MMSHNHRVSHVALVHLIFEPPTCSTMQTRCVQRAQATETWTHANSPIVSDTLLGCSHPGNNIAEERKVGPQRCPQKPYAFNLRHSAVQDVDIAIFAKGDQFFRKARKGIAVVLVITGNINDRRIRELRPGPGYTSRAHCNVSGENNDIDIGSNDRDGRKLQMQIAGNVESHTSSHYSRKGCNSLRSALAGRASSFHTRKQEPELMNEPI